MRRPTLMFLLLLCVALWGWTFTGVKGAIGSYSVMGFLALRFAVAAVALGVAFAAFARRWHGPSLGMGAVMGLVLTSSYLLQTYGLAQTSSTNNGIITGLFLVFTPIFNGLLFGVRTRAISWGAIGASFMGLVLLAGQGPNGINFGDVLTVCAAASLGLHIALQDRYARHYDPLTLTLGQILTAAAIFMLLWLSTETPTMPAPEVWTVILICGLFATAAAFFVQILVQRHLSAVQTASILMLESVFAALIAFIWAGDRLSGVQWMGAALMVGAVCVVEIYGSLHRKGPLGPTRIVGIVPSK